MKFINSVIFALLSFNALGAEITITPMTEVVTATVVTTGLPFSRGELNQIEEFKLFDDTGKEIRKFIKPTMFWFDEQHQATSIRAVKIQFQVGELTQPRIYSFNVGTKSELIVLAETSIKTNLMFQENKSYFPKVIATLDSSYLESSAIIPPFSSIDSNDFYDAQISWAKELNYNTSTIANWLFDRTTALYKGCMRTGDVSCYKEAYMSYNYWMSSLKRDGNLLSCKGGSLLAGEPKNCDSKYAYTEQIKIHLALTGDDSLHDIEFVNDIAALRDSHYYQPKVDDAYDVESESFTERAAGIVLLTQINAYELTGSDIIYQNIIKRINVLYGHQNENPDNLPVDGSWRHSWAKHEGASYPGDGNLDDRRFSPWMTENIIDALWQAYHLTSDDRIPEMINKAFRALIDWGFTDSQGYIDKFGKSLEGYSGKSWHLGCNTTKDTLLYSATSVGGIESIIKTQDQDGYYSDSHNAEAMFILSLGYYFETNEAYRELGRVRINSIREGYLNTKCGSMSNTPRMFNWSNRSNYWGTYNWVLVQNPELLIVKAEVGDDLTGDVIVDFIEGNIDSVWENPIAYETSPEGALFFSAGVHLLKPLAFETNYQLDLLYQSSSSGTLNFGLVINQTQQGFYSVRVKSGTWGGVYIYKHGSLSDLSGVNVASVTSIENELSALHKLTVKVKGSLIIVGIDGEDNLTYDAGHSLNEGAMGVVHSSLTNAIKLQKLYVNVGLPKVLKVFEESFEKGLSDNWSNTGAWEVVGENLVPMYESRVLTLKEYEVSNYSIKSDIILNSMQGNLVLGIVFARSDEYLYTLKIKGGKWGGIFIYRLDRYTSWDVSGAFYDVKYQEISFDQLHSVKVSVMNNSVNVAIDDLEPWNVTLEENVFIVNVRPLAHTPS